MTPQELKNSILQLAIQGKLVEQRPEEGTAQELYREIQAEKQRLIKAGKIKKEKPLPEITEEEKPFEIPESWMWIRLGNVIHYTIGKTPPRAEAQWWGQGVPWVSIADMPENGHIQHTKEAVTGTAISEIFGGNISKASTLLMSFKLTLGRVSILDVDAVHNEAIISIYPLYDNEKTLQQYLFEILPFVSQFGESKNAIKGKTLNRTSISNMLIALPPIAEQKRIIGKIEELLPYIARYDEAWSRLDAFNKRFPDDMRKSILQLAIQGKLVEQRPEEGTGEELCREILAEKQRLIKERKIKKEKTLPEITEDEKPFEIPESWKWVRFNDVVEVATNLVSPDDYPDYMHIAPDNIEKGTGRLLNCKTVSQDGVSSPNHFFKCGQLLYSKIRPLLRKVVLAPFDGLCSADMYPLNTGLYVDYVKYYLLSDVFNNQIAEIMSTRVKMPKVNQSELSKTIIPIPPLAEQKRIVAQLEELLPLCERLK